MTVLIAESEMQLQEMQVSTARENQNSDLGLNSLKNRTNGNYSEKVFQNATSKEMRLV